MDYRITVIDDGNRYVFFTSNEQHIRAIERAGMMTVVEKIRKNYEQID